MQDIFEAAIEPLDHAILLKLHRGLEVVLDAELGAGLVELVMSRGDTLA